MTKIFERRRRPLVTIFDFGARAYCPDCGSCVADIRYNHEREGMFYVVDYATDEPRPLALVYSHTRARLITHLLAERESGTSCGVCIRRAQAAALTALRNPVVHRLPAGSVMGVASGR